MNLKGVLLAVTTVCMEVLSMVLVTWKVSLVLQYKWLKLIPCLRTEIVG